MATVEVEILHMGTTLGQEVLDLFHTPDGGHGVFWRHGFFTVTMVESGLIIDISTQSFKSDDCEACTHPVDEIPWHAATEGTTHTGTVIDGSPMTRADGGRLKNALRKLILDVMAVDTQCLPEGHGRPLAEIETLAGLELALPQQDRYLTWSILRDLALNDDVVESPRVKKSPRRWRLTARGFGKTSTAT